MNTGTMKKVSHKNKWNMGVVQLHVEPQTTPLIKSKHNDDMEKYFLKLKLRRYPMSEKSDLYEFKMAFFDNGDT